jgi:hypothetical protein
VGGENKDKPMRDALRLVAAEEVEVKDDKGHKIKVRKARMVALALFDAAMQGDVPAIKEINDRLDGRVPQAPAALILDELPVGIINNIIHKSPNADPPA